MNYGVKIFLIGQGIVICWIPFHARSTLYFEISTQGGLEFSSFLLDKLLCIFSNKQDD